MAKKVNTEGSSFKPMYCVDDGNAEPLSEMEKRKIKEAILLEASDGVVVTDIADEWDCPIEDHEGEDREYMIELFCFVGRCERYLITVVWCPKCKKYYIDQYDFDCLYRKGNPNFYAFFLDCEPELNLRPNYYETGNGVFTAEENTLKRIENLIDKEIEEIKRDTVKRDRVSHLTRLANSPYKYHAYCSENGEKYEVLLGEKDEWIPSYSSNKTIISRFSLEGRALINFALMRKKVESEPGFFIERTVESDIQHEKLFRVDIIAQNIGEGKIRDHEAGPNDSKIIELILKGKKRGSVSIESTIMEFQYEISDVPLGDNLIVQGCAGSGKTVMMLYRLATQRYLHPDFDFDNAVIITPNENFGIFIRGMMRDLGVADIQIKSVEQYYLDTIRLYSEELVPKEKPRLEMRANQKLLDYVYSGNFVTRFDLAYEKMMQERNKVLEDYNFLVMFLRIKTKPLDINEKNIDYREAIKIIEKYFRIIEKDNQEMERIREKLESHKANLNMLNDEKSENIQRIKSGFFSYYSEVKKKMEEYIEFSEKQKKQLKETITEKREILKEIQKNPKAEKSVTRVVLILKEISRINKEFDHISGNINSVDALINEINTLNSNDEFEEWLLRAKKYVPEIQTIYNRFLRSEKRDDLLTDDIEKLEQEIKELESSIKEKEAKKLPQKICDMIERLYEKLPKLSVEKLFLETYEKALEKFLGDNEIRRKAGVYRFDLYSRLYFCKKYFGGKMDNTSLFSIDEGQDISENEFMLLREINSGRAVFNVYGDTNQLLKSDSGIKDWTKLKSMLRAEKIELDINFRNTDQIVEYCNNRLGLSVKKIGIEGPEVKVIKKKEFENMIAKEDYKKCRVAIVIARTIKKNPFRADYFPSEMAEGNVENGFGKGKIDLLHVDEAKGVEYDKVYAVLKSMSKSETYIACTRALAELVVVEEE